MNRLKMEKLSLKSQDQQWLLAGIHGSFEPAKVNMVLGPNGSGKTLLLRCLAGLMLPTKGSVQIGSKSLHSFNLMNRSRLIGWLPTHCHIPFNFTVFDVLLMGRFPFHQGNITSNDRIICRSLLAELNIEALSQRTYLNLSQGEQVKVQLARVLAADPSYLILDEICANLDIKAKIDVLKLLQVLAQRGKTIILSHHDLHSVAGYADYILMMKDGRIAAQGPTTDIFQSQMIENVFGLKPRIWHRFDQESLSLIF
ncbi:MAG: ABC transporter ATP-binding protein [Oligoflexus sp.]